MPRLRRKYGSQNGNLGSTVQLKIAVKGSRGGGVKKSGKAHLNKQLGGKIVAKLGGGKEKPGSGARGETNALTAKLKKPTGPKHITVGGKKNKRALL